jgi:hypothetical protein
MTVVAAARGVVKWTVCGALLGGVAALPAAFCLGFPMALPGLLIAPALTGMQSSHIMSCSGTRIDILAPVNALVYGSIAGVIGLLRLVPWRRRMDGLPRCTRCHYLLRGNTSGVCPECGTPLSPSQRSQLLRSSKIHRSSPRRQPRADEVAGRDDDPGRSHPF